MAEQPVLPGTCPTVGTYQRLFADDLVQANSLDEFMQRYRRHDRYGARSEREQDAIRRCHESELRAHGITWIAHYDSATGKLVSWMPSQEAARG